MKPPNRPPPGIGHNQPPGECHALSAAPLTNTSPILPVFNRNFWKQLSMTPKAIAMRELRAAEKVGLTRTYHVRIRETTREKAIDILERKHPHVKLGTLTEAEYDALLGETLGEILDAALADHNL